MTNDGLQGKQRVLQGKRKQSSLFPVGPVTLIFIFFNIFSYISTQKWLQKNYFLYTGCRTHLLRFHGERPYHVRVESQVVVSLGASEFCLPLNVGAFWFTARDMFNPPIEKNVFESGIAYIYTALKSLRQVKKYIMLSAPINYFSFKFQWTAIPILATLCAPWKKTMPLWRSRLCSGFFHTACLFTVRRLK